MFWGDFRCTRTWSTKSSKMASNRRLYEMGKVEIVVANPFEENVEFAISIKNINKKKTDEMRDILRMTAKNKRKGKNRIVQDVEFKSTEIESLVPMFFTQQQSIKIKKHSATKLALFYQPLTFEPHQAQIGRIN